MVGLKIEDVKGFTSKLFVKEDFDLFLVKEVQIVTFNSFSIDGHIRKGYFSEEELEEIGDEGFAPWKLLRPVCFGLIKGKRCRPVRWSALRPATAWRPDRFRACI